MYYLKVTYAVNSMSFTQYVMDVSQKMFHFRFFLCVVQPYKRKFARVNATKFYELFIEHFFQNDKHVLIRAR